MLKHLSRSIPKGEMFISVFSLRSFSWQLLSSTAKQNILSVSLCCGKVRKQREGAKSNSEDIFRRFRNLSLLVCQLRCPFYCCEKTLQPKASSGRKGFICLKTSGHSPSSRKSGQELEATHRGKLCVDLLLGSHWAFF